MPLNTVPSIHKEIAKRMKAGKTTIYRLATNMEFDRTTMRRILADKRDVQLSTFIDMVKALQGEVKIEWKD